MYLKIEKLAMPMNDGECLLFTSELDVLFFVG